MKHREALPALYVGRFQPFHLGHLDAVKQIFEKEERMIIVIGSAKESRTKKNPFTAGERFQMIKAALPGMEIIIIPICDINKNSQWVTHVESLIPPFGKVYTGSPLVKKLFEESKRHKVFPLKIRLKINATEIRKKMTNHQPWRHLVPPAVAKLVKKLYAI